MSPGQRRGADPSRVSPTANAAAAKLQVQGHPGALDERLRHDPDLASEQSCDQAWLHLVSAGLVSTRADDLVTATLRTVLAAARGEVAA